MGSWVTRSARLPPAADRTVNDTLSPVPSGTSAPVHICAPSGTGPSAPASRRPSRSSPPTPHGSASGGLLWPYTPRHPLALVWFRELTATMADPRQQRVRLLRQAILRSLDECPDNAPGLRHALTTMLVREPRWMRRASLFWSKHPLPSADSANGPLARDHVWTHRAYASIAIHLWDLCAQSACTGARTPITLSPAPLVAALTIVPAELADLLTEQPRDLDLIDASARLHVQDRTQPWTIDLARVLVRAYREQVHRRDGLPASVAHAVLGEAVLTHAAHNLWTAVPLARELLSLSTKSRQSLDIASRAVPVANNNLTQPVALDLLASIAAALDSDRHVQGLPLDEVYVAETHQQLALYYAGTLASYLQAHLPYLLQRAQASLHQLSSDAVAAAESARRRLEGLPSGWETGGHGGDARDSWLLQPVLTQASVALAAAAAHAQEPSQPQFGPAFERLNREAVVLLEQSTDRFGKARLHGQVRQTRMLMTLALVRRDANDYTAHSATARRLLEEAVHRGPHFTEGLAADRFVDLDAVARTALHFTGHTLPASMPANPSVPHGATVLKRLLGAADPP
jgi:hypothetical protein